MGDGAGSRLLLTQARLLLLPHSLLPLLLPPPPPPPPTPPQEKNSFKRKHPCSSYFVEYKKEQS